MTYVKHGTIRWMALFVTASAVALTSFSSTAQVKDAAPIKKPEKVEEQESAPDRPDEVGRLPKDRTSIPEWTIQTNKPQEVDCSGTETVKFLPLDVYPLAPVRGDTELGGSPYMEISASIKHTAGRILLSGHVFLDEPATSGIAGQAGDTSFKGNFAFDNIIPKPGCVIENVTPVSGKIKDWSTYHHDWDTFSGAELVESANCRLDTRGDDEGKVGCKNLRLRPITVSYRKIDEARICQPVKVEPRIGAIFPTRTQTGPLRQDMDGHRVNIHIDSRARVRDIPDGKGQELLIETSLSLNEAERRGMRTKGEAGQRNVFLTAFDAPGCRIVEVNPSTGTLRAKSSAGNHKFNRYGGGRAGEASGMIDFANCRTDTKGKDYGKIGCTEIAYKPLTITLEPE